MTRFWTRLLIAAILTTVGGCKLQYNDASVYSAGEVSASPTPSASASASASSSSSATGFAISSVSPSTGSFVGGTQLNIYGSAYQAGDLVTVGGAPCTPVVRISSSQLSCPSPPFTPTTESIVISRPDNSASVSLPNAFSYTSNVRTLGTKYTGGLGFGTGRKHFSLSSAGDGITNVPSAIAVDSANGHFYVGDNTPGKLTKYSIATGLPIGSTGRLLRSNGTCPNSGVPSTWCTGGSFSGSITGQSFDGNVNPGAVALDVANDLLYATDSATSRVVKHRLSTGEFIGAIGKFTSSTGTCPTGVATGWCTGGTPTSGTVDGSFGSPSGLAIDKTNGFFYVSDNYSRVQKFNLSTGTFVGAIGNTSATTGTCPASGAAPGWCTGGTFTTGAGNGMFNIASALAVDPTAGTNALYVVDSWNHRVSKFNLSTGVYGGSFGYKNAGTSGTCAAGAGVTGWCTGGTFASNASDGGLAYPTGLTLDVGNNRAYVAETNNHRISLFNLSAGTFVGAIGYKSAGTAGTCPAGAGFTGAWCTGGTFPSPPTHIDDGTIGTTVYISLALDSTQGVLYSADQAKIQKFNASTGAFLGASGSVITVSGGWTYERPLMISSDNAVTITAGMDGALGASRGVALDLSDPTPSNRTILVLNASGGYRVSKYNLETGAYIGSVGNTTASSGTCPASGVTSGWCTGGAFATGASDGMLGGTPGDVVTDSQYFYVADTTRIQRFNLATGVFNGAIGYKTGSTGSCAGGAGATTGWCTGGAFTTNTGDGGFSSARYLAIGGGFLYVSDYNANKISKFNASTGVFVGATGYKNAGTTGTCPAGAGASGSFCTGGTFAASAVDGGFSQPVGIGLDATNGFIFVAEQGNPRVQKLSTAGAAVGAIGGFSATSGSCPGSGAATGWCTGGTPAPGSTDGKFSFIYSITADAAKNFLYVGDSSPRRISKFNLSTGAFIGSLGHVSSSSGTCPSSGYTDGYCTGGTFSNGSGEGSISLPSALTVDSGSSYLFVADETKSVVHRFPQ